MGYQLYIQILAQYNPGVLHVCDREGYVCVDYTNRSRQSLPLCRRTGVPALLCVNVRWGSSTGTAKVKVAYHADSVSSVF